MAATTTTDRAGALAFYAQVLDQADLLAGAEREHQALAPRRWRFDWAWPAARVAVEVDGGQWAPNGGRHARDSDREKLNTAAAAGWRVLRFSTQQLQADPRACLALLRAALGWGSETNWSHPEDGR